MTSKTICIIGGSFDPIHMGHLQMARSSQAQCMADEVWFMPAGDPWQKSGQLVASANDRAHLVQLAISGVHSWKLNRLEINRSGPTYTVESLEALAEENPHHRFSFVIGSDQLQNLTNWKYWNSLFDYVRLGVVDRAGTAGFKVPQELKHHLMKDRLFRIPMPEFNVSSTA
ncbi:MAG: nicotinate (nicotinamide) nucleotide adenylyltransferase, partial [Limnobacter sp.]|nr:nicotinate (nicotinamide) nucleotide adenylyltransferase [Limnobacter sp.]